MNSLTPPAAPKYIRPAPLSLRIHPHFDERWVQQRIADDPSILGLGDLVLKDKERIQPRAGRIDLLLQDPDSSHRYEVEVQLGKTDESHIIRTIEYWDLERKRYPQYEHTAVLVAEEITGRFLNVISLFNGFIPVVAIQMKAYQLAEYVSLVFTTVLDYVPLGRIDDDEEIAEVTDRSYWEKRASKATLLLADQALTMLRDGDPSLTLKYNKFYIGLARDGRPDNFVILRPKKQWLTLEARLEQSDEVDSLLAEGGLDLADYDKNWGRYRLRLTADDLDKHDATIRKLIALARRDS